jgi:hypothetical protein
MTKSKGSLDKEPSRTSLSCFIPNDLKAASNPLSPFFFLRSLLYTPAILTILSLNLLFLIAIPLITLKVSHPILPSALLYIFAKKGLIREDKTIPRIPSAFPNMWGSSPSFPTLSDQSAPQTLITSEAS